MDLLFYLQLVFVVVANMLAYGHCFCSTEYDFTTIVSCLCRYVRSGCRYVLQAGLGYF